MEAVNVAVVNLNLESSEIAGCERIGKALAALRPDVNVARVHFADVRERCGGLDGADGIVLGPQGTPFSRYDAGFLPWLRELLETCGKPVLGVCGGMQAACLAFGGALGSVEGRAVGLSYDGLRKVRGPLPVRIDADALPQWLPARARESLQAIGTAPFFESHVEHVTRVPAALLVIGSSAVSPVEAVAHHTLPVLASQFHPELGWELAGDAGCVAGKVWLSAWLELLRQNR
jgi:GMP synthase-like glutamine amidotransferase